MLGKLGLGDLLCDLHPVHHSSESPQHIGVGGPRLGTHRPELTAGHVQNSRLLQEFQRHLRIPACETVLAQIEELDALVEPRKFGAHGAHLERFFVHEPCQDHALIAGIGHHAKQDHILFRQGFQKCDATLPFIRRRTALSDHQGAVAHQRLQVEHYASQRLLEGVEPLGGERHVCHHGE